MLLQVIQQFTGMNVVMYYAPRIFQDMGYATTAQMWFTAIVGLTNVLSIEGVKNNIKVNAICPVAKTRMTEDLLGPLGDKLSPETVTPVVAYLVHEDCPVTGESRNVTCSRTSASRPRRLASASFSAAIATRRRR